MHRAMFEDALHGKRSGIEPTATAHYSARQASQSSGILYAQLRNNHLIYEAFIVPQQFAIPQNVKGRACM